LAAQALVGGFQRDPHTTQLLVARFQRLGAFADPILQIVTGCLQLGFQLPIAPDEAGMQDQGPDQSGNDRQRQGCDHSDPQIRGCELQVEGGRQLHGSPAIGRNGLIRA
jgi:hypothetical protein